MDSIKCVLALCLVSLAFVGCDKTQNNKKETTMNKDINMENYEVATFAAGCFWGVEQLFRETEGVIDTDVGYTGGHAQNPTYKQVCADSTGHAEAVEVIYDPKIVNYEKLLNIFWAKHDPTTLNRQGPDFGSQYRSVIFYHNEKQKEIAERSKQEQGKNFSRRIVTEITPASEFYRAEEYHQQYLEKRGIKVCH